MYNCLLSKYEPGSFLHTFMTVLLFYGPFFLGVIVGYIVYELVLLFGRYREGLKKVKATYVDDGSRTGFTFEYQNKTHFIHSRKFGNKKLINGKRYTAYFNPNKPQELHDVMKLFWVALALVLGLIVGICVFCLTNVVTKAGNC